jgi:AcrR family transcriptional regulator
MVRQARSDATRRKIIDAAMNLFNEVGYSAARLSEIIERSQMTKGAFYYHFSTKESVASAIIEHSNGRLLNAVRDVLESPAPALESIIHGAFALASLNSSDIAVRTGAQLIREVGEFSGAAARSYEGWLEILIARARRASAEGDVRGNLDPDAVGESILYATLGAWVVSSATAAGDDVIRRLSRTWEVLLPAIATDESLPYFREFVARESLRHLRPALSIK